MRHMQENADLAATVCKILQSYPEIRIAMLFGSSVTGRLTKGSDVDLAIAGDVALPMRKRLILTAELAKGVGREVDLVDMQAVSGLILQQILTTGIMLRKDVASYAALLKRMLFEQADMMPYTERVRRAHVERFLHG